MKNGVFLEYDLMGLREYFNVSIAKPEGRGQSDAADADVAPTKQPIREGAFVTEQSFFSFTGMTGLIWLTMSVLRHLGVESRFTGVILALIAGAFLYYLHETDPNRPKDGRKPVRLAVAFANTMQLYAAVEGIQVVTAT